MTFIRIFFLSQLLTHCSIQMTTRVICLVSKFNDGIKNNIRWKPGTMAAEKEHLKDKGVFVFSANELLKPAAIFRDSNQVKKRSQSKKATKKTLKYSKNSSLWTRLFNSDDFDRKLTIPIN